MADISTSAGIGRDGPATDVFGADFANRRIRAHIRTLDTLAAPECARYISLTDNGGNRC